MARFWCIPNCDYFFYTDWSSDRLTNGHVRGDAGPIGEPVPLFELVFHDCYIAGFSGGGYATYTAGYGGSSPDSTASPMGTRWSRTSAPMRSIPARTVQDQGTNSSGCSQSSPF